MSVTRIAGSKAAQRRYLRRLAAEMDKWTNVARILRMHKITPSEEAEDRQRGVFGPLGPREECYAVVTDGVVTYYDGDHNPLEPLWVLEQVRGTAAAPVDEKEVREHPWMRDRAPR